MSPDINRQVLLAARPAGEIKDSDFQQEQILEGEESIQGRIIGALAKAQLSEKPVFYLAVYPLEHLKIRELFHPRGSKLCELIENPPVIRGSGFGIDVGQPSDILAGTCSPNSPRRNIASVRLLKP